MIHPGVLAKAEHLNKKVIAITKGTSPLGKAICELAAAAGASVFALDADPTLLAKQAISFRQNNLRLRGVSCDLSSENSVQDAVQEIVSHAPPIDYWVHAEVLTNSDSQLLKPMLLAFKQHFNARGKGCLIVVAEKAQCEDLKQALEDNFALKESSEKAILTVVTSSGNDLTKLAKDVVMRLHQP